MSKQGQITLDIQITGSSALLQLVPLLIVNKYSKFQMDTFDSFGEMDSDKKLNRPRRRSDDNSSTFFLRSRAKKERELHSFLFTIKYILYERNIKRSWQNKAMISRSCYRNKKNF